LCPRGFVMALFSEEEIDDDDSTFGTGAARELVEM
jgi:hypothetical protein